MIYFRMLKISGIVDFETENTMAKEKKPDTTIAQNKKAYHDYFVDETYEAGISLFGTEVKSVREGRVNLKDSYVSVKGQYIQQGPTQRAQAVTSQKRNKQAYWLDSAAGLHADTLEDVFQGFVCQGSFGTLPREKEL